VPVLAIRGERGMMLEEADLRARLPQQKMSLHTVAGAGHHVHIDAPEEVARFAAAAS